mgnify:CR=1 FL=1
MAEIQQYLSPVIMGLCLLLGNTIKTSVPKIPNNYIPLALGLIGAILMVALNGLSVQNLIVGLVSGLSATGVHQIKKELTSEDEQRYPGGK